MPHVALVVPAIGREGITKQVANQIKVLQQENIDVFLIVLTIYNSAVMAEFGVRLSEHNVIELQQPAPYLSVQALLKSYSTIRPVLKFLKRNKVSMVVAHAAYAHFVMRLAKAVGYLSRYPFILHQHFHGLQYAQFPVNSLRRFIVNKLNQILAKLFDDSHIYISKAVKADVEENLVRIKKQGILYNPIDTEQALAESKEVNILLAAYREAFVIVLPGRLDHNKGQLFFARVLEQFLRQREIRIGKLMVLIVGSGEIESELEAEIAESNVLQHYVRLVGELPNINLRYLLHLAHLVVVPSFVEGFSFVALESLAAGKMLLVSDAGGLKEVVTDGKTGFVFKAGDKRDCLAKLNYIYENRDKELINRAKIEQDLKLKFSYEQHKRDFLQHVYSISVK